MLGLLAVGYCTMLGRVGTVVRWYNTCLGSNNSKEVTKDHWVVSLRSIINTLELLSIISASAACLNCVLFNRMSTVYQTKEDIGLNSEIPLKTISHKY